MKAMIGIMADSHDNLTAVRLAVRLFNDAKCDLVIHAGDFVAPFAALELHNLSCPVKAVFGNCDGEKKGLTAAFEGMGEIARGPARLRPRRPQIPGLAPGGPDPGPPGGPDLRRRGLRPHA